MARGPGVNAVPNRTVADSLSEDAQRYQMARSSIDIDYGCTFLHNIPRIPS
jgi:hypothetical protein